VAPVKTPNMSVIWLMCLSKIDYTVWGSTCNSVVITKSTRNYDDDFRIIMNFRIILAFQYKIPYPEPEPQQNSSCYWGSEAGISVNLGHPQGCALKLTLNFLGRIPCLSLIGIDFKTGSYLSTLKFRPQASEHWQT
jgi:hypothetical protein